MPLHTILLWNFSKISQNVIERPCYLEHQNWGPFFCTHQSTNDRGCAVSVLFHGFGNCWALQRGSRSLCFPWCTVGLHLRYNCYCFGKALSRGPSLISRLSPDLWKCHDSLSWCNALSLPFLLQKWHGTLFSFLSNGEGCIWLFPILPLTTAVVPQSAISFLVCCPTWRWSSYSLRTG